MLSGGGGDGELAAVTCELVLAEVVDEAAELGEGVGTDGVAAVAQAVVSIDERGEGAAERRAGLGGAPGVLTVGERLLERQGAPLVQRMQGRTIERDDSGGESARAAPRA